jgi:hypothetical protein
MEDFSMDTKPAPSEQGGSQWIDSTVTGLLGLGGESPDDPKDDNPEQSFKRRKHALDIDGNQLEEETKQTEMSIWFGDGLTSAFGFDEKAPEERKWKSNPQLLTPS